MAFTNTAWGGRRTAWHDAINDKDLKKLEWLIKKWPDDIEISGGQHGESPLMWACYKPPPTRCSSWRCYLKGTSMLCST